VRGLLQLDTFAHNKNGYQQNSRILLLPLQLAMKFLEKDELSNYTFQNDFMRPFVAVIRQSQVRGEHTLLLLLPSPTKPQHCGSRHNLLQHCSPFDARCDGCQGEPAVLVAGHACAELRASLSSCQ
jgi:hypothetical protein